MTDSPTPYRVLARKYRPQVFDDLIGQEAMVRTLANAFATGRIAQAYMLTGLRGIGKTTTARLIARALNYPAGPAMDMPELTAQCEAILESRHMDVIEMDAASNTGVDNMREIIDSVRYAPVQARYKVYIIDEVHMLSKSAFNALLKTLEEPPPHVKFIFATTEIRKVPVTILSRCQRFDLRRMDATTLVGHYGKIAKLENVEAEDEALRLIARAAEGSVRDGLSLLDQAIAYGDGKVKTADVMVMLGLMDRGQVIDLFEAVMAGDAPCALAEADKQYQAGGEPVTILNDLADFVHWVTRLKVVPQSAAADGARTEDEKTRGADFAKRLSMPHVTRVWQMLLKGISETALAAQPMQAAEMVIIRLAHAANLPSGDELLKQVQSDRASAPRAAPPANAPQAPMAEARVTAQIRPQSNEAQVPPTVMRGPSDFADIVALAAEKRDIKFKHDLERYVRPISVADGRIELAMEPGADATLSNELSRKLEQWTGKRWIVAVSKAGGEATIAQQKRDAKDTKFKWAHEQPDVQAILKAFPGAKVEDVKDLDILDITEETETDEESR
ncbi:DNA polymerase III subunit gamma/tau [Aestuariivirga litoralis]|uniref:DNA polymerase III subunit gamma/tau n=1 Tax=Aestuariivirga litoralis TaxID=2650924 RepID=UPI0018C65F22|nr:DNA polymerase III subunit gamma/tau [Aestuariivirga litoralis]